MPPNKAADSYEMFHYSLVMAHDVLRAGMDQIIKYTYSITESDIHNFIGYVQAFIASFQGHHEHEEHIVFPAVSPKIPIDQFVEEHQKLEKMLSNISEYTTKVINKEVSYESAKIIESITEVGDLIRSHLKNEEETFTIQALREKMTAEELNKILNKIKEEAKKDGATTKLPFMLLHLAPEDRDFMILDSMPWLVKSVLVPYVFLNWNKGFWKYAKYQR